DLWYCSKSSTFPAPNEKSSSVASSSSKSNDKVLNLPGTRLDKKTFTGAAIKCACFDCGIYTKKAKIVTVWIHHEIKNKTMAAVGDKNPKIAAIPLATGSDHVAAWPSQICNMAFPNKTESISVPMKIKTSPAYQPLFKRTSFSI